MERRTEIFRETLPNGRSFRIAYFTGPRRLIYHDDVVLGDDEFFVRGDFRDNSNDSIWRGIVRREEITGIVRSVYSSASSDRNGQLLE